MKTIYYIIFSMFISMTVFGQLNDSFIGRMGHVYVLNPAEIAELDRFSLKENSKYFEDKWFGASLKLISGKVLEFEASRYDLANDEIEIYLEGTIYTLENQYLDEFIVTLDNMESQKFKRVTFENSKSAFLLELVAGDVSLFKEFYFKTKKANFNVALNTGSKKDKKILKTRYYIQQDGEYIEIPSKKKKARKLFKKIFGEELINNHKVDPKKEASLKAFFLTVNSKL